MVAISVGTKHGTRGRGYPLPLWRRAILCPRRAPAGSRFNFTHAPRGRGRFPLSAFRFSLFALRLLRSRSDPRTALMQPLALFSRGQNGWKTHLEGSNRSWFTGLNYGASWRAKTRNFQSPPTTLRGPGPRSVPDKKARGQRKSLVLDDPDAAAALTPLQTPSPRATAARWRTRRVTRHPIAPISRRLARSLRGPLCHLCLVRRVKERAAYKHQEERGGSFAAHFHRGRSLSHSRERGPWAISNTRWSFAVDPSRL